MIWRAIDLVYRFLPRGAKRWLARKRLGKYRNPDRRCTYPFEPSPVGYCCGYAVLVDQNKPLWWILESCRRECPFWKDEPDRKEAD